MVMYFIMIIFYEKNLFCLSLADKDVDARAHYIT